MAKTRSKLFLLCFICLSCAAHVAAGQALSASELAATYTFGHRYGGNSIKLEADGSYSEDSGGCTFTTHESGSYVLVDGVLRFTILKYTGTRNSDYKEFDLFDPEARKEFFGYRDNEEVQPLKTEFTMLPIKWSDRIYLIQEQNIKDFVNAINLHLEPRTRLSTHIYYNSFLLREGDEQKIVSGKPSLPGDWESLLLSTPVTAKIVSIEREGNEKTATINKGSRHGLKVGMRLVSTDSEQEPRLWSEEGEVLTVTEKSATVRVYEWAVRENLSTKYILPEIYR